MHRDGYMMHKYQPDRAIGSTWHPLVHNKAKELAIQEDETASVIFMIGQYYRASSDQLFIENFYDSFIQPCTHFLANYVDRTTDLPHASYDLWEEKFLTNTYTVSVTIAALETASEIAKLTSHPDDFSVWKQAADRFRKHLDTLYSPENYFYKGYLLQPDGNLAIDKVIDISSLYGVYMYSGLSMDDPRIIGTYNKVMDKLTDKSPIGGVVRYENDHYLLGKTNYIGNPWVVCTLWLAQFLIAKQDKQSALKHIQWSLDRRMKSGILSEQFDPEDGKPIGVAPLVWSHAELISTLLDYYDY